MRQKLNSDHKLGHVLCKSQLESKAHKLMSRKHETSVLGSQTLTVKKKLLKWLQEKFEECLSLNNKRWEISIEKYLKLNLSKLKLSI